MYLQCRPNNTRSMLRLKGGLRVDHLLTSCATAAREWDCPSTRSFIAAPDGNGYVSASDVEDDLVLAANIVADLEEDEGQAIDSIAATADFPSLLV